ncbi:class I SAM-dependent methyltransferase [Magnetococcus sp. PR-3]|uniref:class I SAM-dependent methyltransferase n=1 Tax=Magnetococcus sp. PR-3 TaxID=3120355 RepID=UPI002FCE246A
MATSLWSDGYLTALNYRYSYHKVLNPKRLELALRLAGFQPPLIQQGCELGFGQGVSLAMHATSTQVQWWGNDFLTDQVHFCQGLVNHYQGEAQLADASFEHFCAQNDLPDFDYMAIHGVWSWVSEENRQILLDFLARKLKPGGVLYLSFNSLPRWAGMVPVRQMMLNHFSRLTASGLEAEVAIVQSLQFMQALVNHSPVFQDNFPGMAKQLTQLSKRPVAYLAHEYFNQHWYPFSFEQVAQQMAQAQLEFACSAEFVDSMESLHLTAAQNALLESAADPTQRQSMRDFMVNQGFRSGYWMKSPTRLTPHQRVDQLMQQPVVLVDALPSEPIKVEGAAGKFQLPQKKLDPIRAALSEHTPQTLSALATHISSTPDAPMQAIAVTQVLLAHGVLQPACHADIESVARAQQLNLALLNRFASMPNAAIYTLVSPHTGGGISVPSEHMSILHTHSLHTPGPSLSQVEKSIIQRYQALGVVV